MVATFCFVDIAGYPALTESHGNALCRHGRYFGSTINVAARTAAQARAGEILCTATMAMGLDAASALQFAVHPLGPVRLKNLSQRVDLYRIVLSDTRQQLVIDPVCQMQVHPRSAAADGWFDGKQYRFCSDVCARNFARAPSSFV